LPAKNEKLAIPNPGLEKVVQFCLTFPSGVKLILATGRRISTLLEIFPPIELFDCVVAENGPIIYTPQTQKSQLLSEPALMPLVDRLKQKGIDNIAVGEVIVATWQPHEHLVRDTLQEMDLSLEIILNKKAIMILPAGVNKASGMKIALEQLKISPEQTVGVGDAENDLDLLNFCGLGVAVDNALTIVKQQADWVTTRERGAGVRELIQKIIKENQFLDNN
jgi:hypothetical protein